MITTHIQNEIHTLISQGEIKKAIETLCDFLDQKNNNSKKDAIHLLAKLKLIQNQFSVQGIISQEVYQLEISKITQGIFTLLIFISEKEEKFPLISKKKNSLKIFAIFLFATTIFAFFSWPHIPSQSLSLKKKTLVASINCESQCDSADTVHLPAPDPTPRFKPIKPKPKDYTLKLIINKKMRDAKVLIDGKMIPPHKISRYNNSLTCTIPTKNEASSLILINEDGSECAPIRIDYNEIKTTLATNCN